MKLSINDQSRLLHRNAQTIYSVAVGFPMIIWAHWRYLPNSLYSDYGWPVLFLLILIPISLVSPLRSIFLYLGTTLVMVIGAYYGMGPCMIAMVAYALIIPLLVVRVSGWASRFLFSAMVCEAFIYGFAYQLISTKIIALAAVLIAAVLFAAASQLIPGTLRSQIPLAITFMLCAIAATFFASRMRFGRYFMLALLPYIFVVFGWGEWMKRMRTFRLKQGTADASPQSVKD